MPTLEGTDPQPSGLPQAPGAAAAQQQAAATATVATLLHSVDSNAPFITFAMDATRINSTVQILVKAIASLQAELGPLRDAVASHDKRIAAADERAAKAETAAAKAAQSVEELGKQSAQRFAKGEEHRAQLDRRVGDLERRVAQVEDYKKDIQRVESVATTAAAEAQGAQRRSKILEEEQKKQVESLQRTDRRLNDTRADVDGLYAVFEASKERAKEIARRGPAVAGIKSGATAAAGGRKASGPAGSGVAQGGEAPGDTKAHSAAGEQPGSSTATAAGAGGGSQTSGASPATGAGGGLSEATQYALSLPAFQQLAKAMQALIDAAARQAEGRLKAAREKLLDDIAQLRAKLAEKLDERAFVQFRTDVDNQFRRLKEITAALDRAAVDLSGKVDKRVYEHDVPELQRVKADRAELLDMAHKDDVAAIDERVRGLAHLMEGHMSKMNLEMRGLGEQARDTAARAADANRRAMAASARRPSGAPALAAAAAAAANTQKLLDDGPAAADEDGAAAVGGGGQQVIVTAGMSSEDLDELRRRLAGCESECERLELVKADKAALEMLRRQLEAAAPGGVPLPSGRGRLSRPVSAASGGIASPSGRRGLTPPGPMGMSQEGPRLPAIAGRPGSGGPGSRPGTPLVYTSLPPIAVDVGSGSPAALAMAASGSGSRPGTPARGSLGGGISHQVYDTAGRRTPASLAGAAKMGGTMAEHWENMRRGMTGDSAEIPPEYELRIME